MVYCDIKMQYLWQNDNRYAKANIFPIFTMYFMAPCACIRKNGTL